MASISTDALFSLKNIHNLYDLLLTVLERSGIYNKHFVCLS